jgi:predicted nucleic acid-binding protein
MELIVGCRNKTDLRSLQKFIKALQILPVTDEISDRASELLILYNLSHNLLIPDSLIAATALIHDEEFVTKNQRDFRFIGGLRLLKY